LEGEREPVARRYDHRGRPDLDVPAERSRLALVAPRGRAGARAGTADPVLRNSLAALFARWQDAITDLVARALRAGRVLPDTDPPPPAVPCSAPCRTASCSPTCAARRSPWPERSMTLSMAWRHSSIGIVEALSASGNDAGHCGPAVICPVRRCSRNVRSGNGSSGFRRSPSAPTAHLTADRRWPHRRDAGSPQRRRAQNRSAMSGSLVSRVQRDIVTESIPRGLPRYGGRHPESSACRPLPRRIDTR
jgi:hypothetical protein